MLEIAALIASVGVFFGGLSVLVWVVVEATGMWSLGSKAVFRDDT